MVSGEPGRAFGGAAGVGAVPLAKDIRMVQIALVGRIKKKTTAAFDLINDGLVELFRNGGAAFAATQETAFANMFFADIVGGMHDDRPGIYMIVDPGLDAVEMQRITIVSYKGIARNVKAKAAHQTIDPIGKTSGHEPARVAAMRNEGVEQQTAVLHVDDKETFCGTRQGKVDDR